MNDDGRDNAPDIAVRVMVVDDHPIWREAVARDLTEAGYDVTAVIGEGAQAIRVAPAARPDVVVLDLQLPDLPGVEVVRLLLATDPAIRVLMLSASGDQQDVLDALKAGALGYLVKSAKPAELLKAVASTAAGDPVVTVGTAGLVLGEYRRLAAVSASPAARPASPDGRPRCCAWSPRACPTSRSRNGSSYRTGRCRTTSRTRSASCIFTTGLN